MGCVQGPICKFLLYRVPNLNDYNGFLIHVTDLECYGSFFLYRVTDPYFGPRDSFCFYSVSGLNCF